MLQDAGIQTPSRAELAAAREAHEVFMASMARISSKHQGDSDLQ
jgi:hypothetical protein